MVHLPADCNQIPAGVFVILLIRLFFRPPVYPLFPRRGIIIASAPRQRPDFCPKPVMAACAAEGQKCLPFNGEDIATFQVIDVFSDFIGSAAKDIGYLEFSVGLV